MGRAAHRGWVVGRTWAKGHIPEIALFGAQGIVMLAWSLYRWTHFDLTWDFGIYAQAAWLIAHGQWYPWSSLRGLYFLQNNGEWMLWPLALLVRLFNTTAVLLVVQALSLAAASAIALHWVREVVAASSLDAWGRRHIVALTTLLLLMDPWLYWTVSFDIHMEVIVLPAVVLAGLALWQRRAKKLLVYSGLTILGGVVTASYLVGVGLSGLLMGQRYRAFGAWTMLSGIVAVLALEHWVPGGIQGSNLSLLYRQYLSPGVKPDAVSVLMGVVTHPARAWSTVWYNRINIYAALAPEGLLGLAAIPALGVPFVILLENDLIPQHMWSSPTLFQSVALVPFVMVGTAMVLARLLTRWGTTARGRRMTLVVLSALLLDAGVWAGTQIPRIPEKWAAISGEQAGLLARVDREIPAHAEVLVSNAFGGRFSNREAAYMLGHLPPTGLPLDGRPVYVVLSPTVGVLIAAPAVARGVLTRFAHLPHVHWLMRQDGLCALVWDPPPGAKTLALQDPRKGPSTPLCGGGV